MEYLFDRKLKLKTETEYKSLYKSAIIEIDEHGKQIGIDQIPWGWSVFFTAINCLLVEQVKVDRWSTGGEEEPVAKENQHISLKLKVRSRGRGGIDFDELSFSMFGTNRRISDISLDIKPLENPSDKERCVAWGIVSYESDDDFRRVTTDDCMGFIVYVSPQKYERYADYLRSKSVSSIYFNVTSVQGFYSEWSPSISAHRIKVLVGENRGLLEFPKDAEKDLPILGDVGEFNLSFSSVTSFEAEEPQENVAIESSAKSEQITETHQITPRVEPIIFDIRPIKKVLWIIVLLLTIIFLRLLGMR